VGGDANRGKRTLGFIRSITLADKREIQSSDGSNTN